jgi:hypothetical protein
MASKNTSDMCWRVADDLQSKANAEGKSIPQIIQEHPELLKANWEFTGATCQNCSPGFPPPLKDLKDISSSNSPAPLPPRPIPQATDEQAIRASDRHWQLVDGIYRVGSGVNYVYISPDKTKDESVYQEAILSICKPSTVCWVLFWTDKSKMPSSKVKLPDGIMTDEQADAEAAQFETASFQTKPFITPSTSEEFMWSCKIVNNPNKCF